MNREQWRPFLKRWSEEWVDAHDPERDQPLEAEVARDRWLGFAPATAEEVAAAEARLGRALPPSLREFLLTTDGWRDAGVFIYRLAGAAELAWLADADEDSGWIEAYSDTEFFDEEEDEEPEGRILARSLRLSLEGDAAVMLLDPEDVDERGEWAAYWLASWSGSGPERFDSFHDLMHDQYVSFHALRRPPGATRDHWDAEVERARLAALAGEVEAPLAVLEEASRFGSDRARLLRFQILAMLGDTDTIRLDRVAVVKEERADFLHTPLFTRELLPLVYAEERQAPMWGSTTLSLLKNGGLEEGRAIALAFDPDEFDPNRLTYGNPEFDAAVHDILDRLDAEGPDERTQDALWPALRAAIALWRPISEDHIAPVALRAHPALAEMITEERGREILSTRRGS
ncbi:SMI1/KNR4 family protein [Streptomyces sp. SAJ15]|uniref:SMI1/KNR4 family protein n=1 Tax=Streptomyces sp. SAJ15 TaxID=2011095 RepID=UPI0011862CC1|nr:SMI1/KNR4 family protein [Streptomyces sp. SAJ15]TVL93743.1 hypothetical protein CD790_01430 [Streptomyces sp. SAJ15]